MTTHIATPEDAFDSVRSTKVPHILAESLVLARFDH